MTSPGAGGTASSGTAPREPAAPPAVLTAQKRIAIVQSSYIPWKGYFDLINMVDEFILFDDAQFTRRDWRNRNRIKTPQGPAWLTIPVRVKGRYHQRIDEVVVSDDRWAERHWRTLVMNYRRAGAFEEFGPYFQELYASVSSDRLSIINRTFIEAICRLLGITTSIRWSSDFPAEGTKSERLVRLCRNVGATAYLSGPTARAYLDNAPFAASGIEVEYMSYEGYPAYPQVHPPFEHAVSIVDLILSMGSSATRYMRSFRDGR